MNDGPGTVKRRRPNVAEMMTLVSQHFNAEVRYASKTLTPMIEPMLIPVLGGMILFFALSILLPIWNLMILSKQ